MQVTLPHNQLDDLHLVYLRGGYWWTGDHPATVVHIKWRAHTFWGDSTQMEEKGTLSDTVNHQLWDLLRCSYQQRWEDIYSGDVEGIEGAPFMVQSLQGWSCFGCGGETSTKGTLCYRVIVMQIHYSCTHYYSNIGIYWTQNVCNKEIIASVLW